MKTTTQYLDSAKSVLGIGSDYALAKALGIRTTTISNYRSGRNHFDDATAIKIAAILKIDPLEVIAAANVERAKNDDARRVWVGLWDRLAANFDPRRRYTRVGRSLALA